MLLSVDRKERRKWLANRLLELRTDLKWDQSAVKNASRGTISKVENSKMDVTVIKLEAILQAYGMTLEEFFTGKQPDAAVFERRRLESPGRRSEDIDRAEIIARYGRKMLLQMSEARKPE